MAVWTDFTFTRVVITVTDVVPVCWKWTTVGELHFTDFKSQGSTMYAVREFENMCLLMALDHVLDYGEVLNVPQSDERNRVVECKEVYGCIS